VAFVINKGDATTGDDALFYSGPRWQNGVLDAVLAPPELDLGRGSGLDDRATSELRKTLLELLTVVVGVGVLILAWDLLDTTGDGFGVAGSLDDRGLVLGEGPP
jgi:hypothetical protein